MRDQLPEGVYSIYGPNGWERWHGTPPAEARIFGASGEHSDALYVLNSSGTWDRWRGPGHNPGDPPVAS